MNGFSILMFALGIGVILCGIYLYTGHRSELLLWRTHNVNRMTKEELKNVGKWTIISGIIIIIIGVIGLFFDI